MTPLDLENINIRNKNQNIHLVESDFESPYWRRFLFCSDGRCVCGCGITPEEAIRNSENNLMERENYIALSDREKLKVLIDGDLLDTDQKEAIRIIAKILLSQPEWNLYK